MVDQESADEVLTTRLGLNIKARRRALGLTQAQLAERLEVETETFSRFERGKHAPSLRTLVRLAATLQTTVAGLLGEERQEPEGDATLAAAWLNALSDEDRAFAMGVLKQCCDYLARRGVAKPSD